MLAHPLTRGLDIDSPETSELRREIIRSKPFLRRIYKEWYAFELEQAAKAGDQLPILELGSGGGFLSDYAKDVITSDVFSIHGIDVLLDAQHMPFSTGSLRAIVMTNVLHHIPQPELFFNEAARCLQHGGRVAMVEPWISTWSRFVYRNFHHEPVDETKQDWTINGEGPLSGANSALPWIIFQRDREKFVERYPELTMALVEPFMPFRYLLSGGVSLRSLMFGFTFSFWSGLEKALSPWMDKLGMFVKIVLVRK